MDSSFGECQRFDRTVIARNFIVFRLTLIAIENTNTYDYPRGRRRLEPLAKLFTAMIMMFANAIMIVSSIDAIVNRQEVSFVIRVDVTVYVADTCERRRTNTWRSRHDDSH